MQADVYLTAPHVYMYSGQIEDSNLQNQGFVQNIVIQTVVNPDVFHKMTTYIGLNPVILLIQPL